MQLTFDDLSTDPCARKHGGAPTSEAAWENLQPVLSEMRARVLEFIRSCGWRGATVKEVANSFGRTPNAVSGRLTELRNLGLIRHKAERRGGCQVLIASE